MVSLLLEVIETIGTWEQESKLFYLPFKACSQWKFRIGHLAELLLQTPHPFTSLKASNKTLPTSHPINTHKAHPINTHKASNNLLPLSTCPINAYKASNDLLLPSTHLINTHKAHPINTHKSSNDILLPSTHPINTLVFNTELLLQNTCHIHTRRANNLLNIHPISSLNASSKLLQLTIHHMNTRKANSVLLLLNIRINNRKANIMLLLPNTQTINTWKANSKVKGTFIPVLKKRIKGTCLTDSNTRIQHISIKGRNHFVPVHILQDQIYQYVGRTRFIENMINVTLCEEFTK
mmetsp:Transcript_2958/g.6414  ORF Transcript_2958/g.6414 Transcript_2958/m.6414 type:complete len:293 (+) Transcript_2958:7693-8571(+)